MKQLILGSRYLIQDLPVGATWIYPVRGNLTSPDLHFKVVKHFVASVEHIALPGMTMCVSGLNEEVILVGLPVTIEQRELPITPRRSRWEDL